MNHSGKPTLLLLTSSFPSSPKDETCGYIRDFARSLAVEFDVTVLAPPDRRAAAWPSDAFKLRRSRSPVPGRLDPLQAGEDLNGLIHKGPLAKAAAAISLCCFFSHAAVLALRADTICSNWMVMSGLVGALISRGLGRRHIVVEHSGALHLLARVRGGRMIARFIVAGSDRVVTVSEDLKDKLVQLCPEAATRAAVIPMGISIPSSEAIADESSLPFSRHPKVLFIGRLTEIKGLDVLLKAIEGLDDLKLIIAGDGETRYKNERLAHHLSLNARFVGSVDALERQRLLSECDVVVIPSRILADGRTEGMPVVCLEAMAAGRVVIASKVGGLAEILSDGENGLLFEHGDHRMLKEKLMLALSDESLRQRISKNAQQSAAAFDWARIGLRFTDLMKAG